MSLGRRPIKVIRPSGSYVAGRWEEGNPGAFTIEASVQPLSGKEMEALPEGRRGKAAFRLYTDFALRTVDDQGGRNPDRIIEGVDGRKVFEVIQVFPWQNGIVDHHKAIVSLLEQAPDGSAE